MLATILRKLGLDVEVEEHTPGADALGALADSLENMPAADARRVAAFAYLLSRVAHADHAVSDQERSAMARLLVERTHLAADRADLVVALATSQLIHVRGTQDYPVAREVAASTSLEEKRALIDGLFAVCASDGLISTVEDNEVRRVASEIDLEHHDVVQIRNRYRDSLAVLKREEA